VTEVGIGYDEDVGRALGVLEATGRAFHEAHRSQVFEPPVAEGILRFGESEVVLRLHARVDAAHKVGLELELRRRIKDALDAGGIELPYPQRVIHLAPDHQPLGRPGGKESLA
jgi:small conductance mechanosensitive channel